MEALLGTSTIALKKKIFRDVIVMSRWSIYPPEIAACELSTSQGLLLALLHSLAEGHTQVCHVLAGLARSLPQLRSTYLKVWLADDFVFCKEWLAEAFSNAAVMERSRGLSLSPHLIAALSHLPSKYNLANYFDVRGDHLSLEFVIRITEDLGSSSVPDNDKPRKRSPIGSLSLRRSNRQDVPDQNQLNEQLFAAVKDNSTEAVSAALRDGADPDSANSSGETALNLAVLGGNDDAARALLAAGAKVNRVQGDPPLCLAATLGKGYMVTLLLSYLADPNVYDREGFNALHRAVMGGYIEIAKNLIDHGANVWQITCGYSTPLHLAVEEGHLGMVRMLLESGADPKAHDGCGVPPLTWTYINLRGVGLRQRLQ